MSLTGDPRSWALTVQMRGWRRLGAGLRRGLLAVVGARGIVGISQLLHSTHLGNVYRISRRTLLISRTALASTILEADIVRER